MLALYVLTDLKLTDAKGVQRNYTFYGDTETPDAFYCLPEAPEIIIEDNGRPDFSLLWFYSSETEKGKPDPASNGGVCTFTLGMPLPDQSMWPEIQAQLKNDTAVIAKAHDIFNMLQAAQEGNTQQAKALQTVLGLSDDQVAALQARFHATDKPTWEDFLPRDDSSSFRLRSVPITGGQVTVRSFATPGAYSDWQNGEDSPPASVGTVQVTPSLLGDNRAVISYGLTSDGVNLFWHAFGGPSFDRSGPANYTTTANSVVTATYQVDFEGMLPPATVTVTLDSKTIAHLAKRSNKDTWGHTRTEIIGRDFTHDVSSNIKVEIPDTSYLSKDDKAKTNMADQLQSWGTNQLADMLKAQLPDVSWADMNEKLTDESVIHDETRTFSIGQATALSKFPQAQLKAIPDLLLDGADLSPYFLAVNLDSTPYFDAAVTVQPPAKLSDMAIASVSVDPTIGGQQLRDADNNVVNTLVFDATNAVSAKLHGRFQKAAERTVAYDYTVNYTSNVAAMTVRGEQQDYNIVLANPARLGVLAGKLDLDNPVPWAFVSAVKLTVSADGQEQDFRLSKEADLPVSLALVTGKEEHDATVEVSMRYTFTDGSSMQIPGAGASEVQLSQTTTYLTTPIASRSVTFYVADVANNKVAAVPIQATFHLHFADGTKKRFTSVVVANKENAGTPMLTIPASGTGQDTIDYTATISGKQAMGTDVTGALITIDTPS